MSKTGGFSWRLVQSLLRKTLFPDQPSKQRRHLVQHSSRVHCHFPAPFVVRQRQRVKLPRQRSYRRLLFGEGEFALHGVLDGRGIAVAVHRVLGDSSSRRLRGIHRLESVEGGSVFLEGEFVDDAIAVNEEVASEAEGKSVC